MSNVAKSDVHYLDHPYTLAGRTIDPIVGVSIFAGKRSPLNRKQLEVLACLAAAGTQIVTRQTFIEGIWRGNALVGEHALSNVIYSLRKQLQDTDPDKPLIRTIPRRGYQLTVAATGVEDALTTPFAAGMPIAGKPGWQLARRLGGNAVGELWLAEQSATGERRVFRFCRSEQQLQLLRRETTVLRYLRQALAGRRDTAVVLDWQLEEPPYHLEMDYASGGSLTEWSQAQGGLAQVAYPERLRLASEVAGALAAVHAADVVHRNLGPASVLIDAGDTTEASHARLGEFGLSELSDRSRLEALQITHAGLTLPGGPAGEAPYLAPERLAGHDATPAGDVYALGVLLLQLETGDLTRSPVGDWEHSVTAQPMRDLIAACTSARPEDRPEASTAAEHLRAAALAARGGDGPRPGSAHADATAASAPAPAPSPPAQAAAISDPAVGSRIGPYQLLDQLGQGGMGVVYLAEQQQPVQRKVALKVVHTGLMSPDVRARFEAERQAMALMNHANVASVFDAGSTPAGQPYFAMEYVQGQDITAHCDQRRLDFRGRIELLLQVCEGVLHAHQKGLVHRDLKPGNILVSRARDQAPVVKIIDFGVAKSMSGLLAANPAHTRLGSFVGTPAYSSPEQISGPIASVDTRADIYSLGVVLYELLSGVTPYRPEELNRKTPMELARLLSSEEPPSPLVRYASLSPEEEHDIAIRRSLSVEQMKAELDADVSWIVGKCLEIDPDDRYPSVLELENDLRRWLDDQPVQARPATRLYRMRKFVRRNRVGVAATTLGVLALLTTTGAAVYGYLRSEQSRQEAELAADFQIKQIQGLDPGMMGAALREAILDDTLKQGRQQKLDVDALARRRREMERLTEETDFTGIAVRQLTEYSLKPGLVTIEKDYAGQPLLQAQLWHTLSESYFALGQLKQAISIMDKAIAIRQRLLGDDHALTLQSLAVRGRINMEYGRYSAAQRDLRIGLAALEKTSGKDDQSTLPARAYLANSLVRLGSFEEAHALHLENLRLRRIRYGASHPETIKSLSAMSWMYHMWGKDKDALRLAEAVRNVLATTPQDNDAIIFNWSVLGTVHLNLGTIVQAETYTRKALEKAKRVYGEEHRLTVAFGMNLAEIMIEQGHCAEAESLYRQSSPKVRLNYGVESSDWFVTREMFSASIECQGRIDEAESITRESARDSARFLDPAHIGTMELRQSLAMKLIELDRPDEAQSLLEGNLKLLVDTPAADDLVYSESAHSLALAHMAQKQYPKAAAHYRDALRIRRRILGDQDPRTYVLIGDIAELSTIRGDYERAETMLRHVLTAQRRLGSAGGRSRVNEIAMIATLQDLIDAILAQDKRGEAEALMQEALALADDAYDARDHRLAKVLIRQANTLIALRRYDEARSLLDRARNNLAQAHLAPQSVLQQLASAYTAIGERRKQASP